MKIKYQSLRFSAAYAVVIEQANQIIASYAAQGHDMTLRQLYYQFVAGNLFPDSWQVKLPTGELVKNHDRNYKKLGEAISNGRLAGLVDWNAIKDRGRSCTQWHSDHSVTDAIQRARDRYSLPKWGNQPCRVEVWVEKDALASIMERTCGQHDVPVFACKGYVSQSAQWEAHRRHKYNFDTYGQPTTILHFGDHDPSGLDMTRDIFDRMYMFNERYGKGDLLTVQRMALNIDQVRKYNPPPAPAKGTDPRFEPYLAEFGGDCWELDALSPTQLGDLVELALEEIIDHDALNTTLERQAEHKAEFDHAIALLIADKEQPPEPEPPKPVEAVLSFRQWKDKMLGKKPRKAAKKSPRKKKP